ncbi:MAG: hypothetical protein QXO19_03810 [Candidatus Aenigmatarchaeota archaeon]
MSENLIRTFEKQSGLIRLLIYLVDHQPINVQTVIENTDIYPYIMYSSLKKAKDPGSLMRTNREEIEFEGVVKNTYGFYKKTVRKFLTGVMYTRKIAFGSKNLKKLWRCWRSE